MAWGKVQGGRLGVDDPCRTPAPSERRRYAGLCICRRGGPAVHGAIESTTPCQYSRITKMAGQLQSIGQDIP